MPFASERRPLRREESSMQCVAAIDASGGAGLGDDDLRDLREGGLEAGPNPEGDVFAGGVFEALDFVEEVVIELLPNGLEGCSQVGVIEKPAHPGIHLASDGDLDLEAVAMDAPALVGGGKMRQEMGCLELKGLAELNAHRWMGFPNRTR